VAYPFCPALSWKELIEHLKEHEVELKVGEMVPDPWGGQQVQMRYLEKKGGGFLAVSFQSDGDWATWSSIRSVCAAFQIDPSDFGLDLG